MEIFIIIQLRDGSKQLLNASKIIRAKPARFDDKTTGSVLVVAEQIEDMEVTHSPSQIHNLIREEIWMIQQRSKTD